MTPLLLEIAILAGALASPLLPAPWSALALLVFAALWLRSRPPRREVGVAGVALLVAVVALGVQWSFLLREQVSEREWVAAARQQYAGLWRGLWEETGNVARSLGPPPQGPQATLAAFRRLAQHEVRAGGGRHGLLLLDPDGNAVAWAGEGLLHELKAEAVPRSGPHFVAGWSAITLLAVEPMDRARRPWRVVAGASFPAQQLPFGHGAAARWSLVRDPNEIAPGALAVAVRGLPTLVVARGLAGPGLPLPEAPLWPRQLAWGAIGFALLALAVVRGVGIALPGSSAGLERRSRAIAPLALGGVLAWGAAARVPVDDLAGLVIGLGLAILGLRWRRRPEEASGGEDGPRRRTAAAAAGMAAGGGAAAVLALVAAAWADQLSEGPLDIGGSLLPEPHVFSARLALAGAACGLLCLASRLAGGPAPPEHEDRWAWLGVALLLAGACLADFAPAALVLLAAGGAVAALWLGQRDLPRSGTSLAALALIAVLAASGAIETAYRLRLQSFAATELLPRFAPPTEAEVTALARDLAAHWKSRDLKNLVPRSPEGLERQDLAFALWRSSPLARRHTLSALVVEPLAGPPSSFSFGMPLSAEGRVDELQMRLAELRPPLWRQALIHGESVLTSAGVPWARARYWMLPRPGFEVADRRDLGEVEVGLLKGEPVASPFQDSPWPALYGLYASDRHAILSPWEEAPPLQTSLARPGTRADWVVTPSGPARAYARRTAGGWEVVYLPFETPLDALERTLTPALSVLLLLALGIVLALLLSLPRAAFRDLLRRTVRSYSKRLLLVYTGLLLVPLLLLNAVLVRTMGERLEREQRTAGEAALNSAQKELGDRFVSLPPGFGIDTALNDTLLTSLSQVVHHEVNLYWRSTVRASSKHELFTAGLLPKRIPGEIYSRLALLGYDLSSRTNHAGDTDYLELYAPLRVPGVMQNEERLFLSIPLLAQQAEAAAELEHLRRRAFLVTAALFVLSVAVGTRLARNFTRPLAQLVLGTRRIAGGATSLDLAPSDLELAALVEAVDEMARRIAEGRERLVREKQVVERMVENITSGVVSVDRERRVLMHNRVAAELLGVNTGQTLERAMERSPRLAPVAAFLRSASGEMARATVRLGGEGGEQEWTLIWAPLPGPGEPSALLVVEDATEVLRGQRLLAWAEMARIIAHEIKNPLTPIRLSAEHMREVYARDPQHFSAVFERCTNNILTQVDELRSIAAEFSAYSAIPRIDMQPGDLTAAIADLVEGYRAAPPEGVVVDLETNGPITTRFDAKLLGRAVRNLLENALRASAGGGRVVVKVERLDGTARIEVSDRGPGVRPELLGRIFDPYFSTHDTGTGLGLPIARRVVEEHGGHIAA
ncbi:MAG TPA: ATP-binding protein, partial [Thermoanaerobaculia bacterium]|nr:ATP-binding protein [Thermoanaerobaculia bacterium]